MNPTFEQLMEAAGRAHDAGDAESARALVQEAKRVRGQPEASKSSLGYEFSDYAPGYGPVQQEDGSYTHPTTAPRQDRFGDTVADAVERPWEMTKTFARGLADQSQSPTNAALPGWVPMRGTVAGVGDLAMTGVGLLGTGLAAGAGLAGEMFGGSPTNEKKLARDLIMASQVAVPELAGVSGTARATGTAANAGERAMRPATAAQRSARAADDLGITPSLGMTGRTGATAAAGLEKVPLAGNLIARDASRAVGEVEGAFAKIRSGVGRAMGSEGAGQVLQRGLEGFVKGFKETSTRLFNAVDEAIPSDRRFPVANTSARLDDAKAVFEGNPELAQRLGLNNWDAVVKEAQTNGVTWNALKQFRSSVGEAIGNLEAGKQGGSLSSENLSRLKSLYGALTEDMQSAARSVGADALQAWTRANNHYRSGAQRIERSLDKTIHADSPERAWDAFSRLLQQDRSSSDIARVRDIKQSLERSDWDIVSASIVDRMGRAPAGQQNATGSTFSPAAFLTNWNKLDQQAKRLLLPEDARLEFEKLAQVAERVKSANVERNFSNTGTAVGWLATIFGSAADMGTTATALGGATLTAKGMTSPVFLRAMNRAARGDLRAMRAMANGNGPFAADAQTVLRLTAAEAATGGPAANTDAPSLPSAAVR